MIMTLSEEITTLQLNNYRSLLIDEMLKLGASEQELQMIKDATIRNAIRRNRKPEDVAWALLQ